MQIQSINSIIISTLMILLSACGGEESGTLKGVASSMNTVSSVSSINISTNPVIMNAGAISGLKVMCNSVELVTYTDGSIKCEDTPVTVYLGEFKIGDVDSVPLDGYIYTQDLFHLTRADIAHPEVTKLSMILQSLDKDAEPLNGITLDSSVLDLLGSHLNNSTILANLTFDNVESIIEDVIQTALSQDANSQLKAVGYDTAQSNLATSVANAPALTYDQRTAGGI